MNFKNILHTLIGCSHCTDWQIFMNFLIKLNNRFIVFYDTIVTIEMLLYVDLQDS